MAKPAIGKSQSVLKVLAIAGVAISVLIFLAIYILRVDRVVGMLLDDAYYVMFAQSLASGQGYRLINSPGAHVLPLYPPGFPFLLSFVFRIAPQFPENYWLLKSVSIAAMLGVGIATYFYCRRVRQMPDYLALLIALTTAIAPPFVFLATSSVMSECVFALTQLLTVMSADRCVRVGRDSLPWRESLLCAVMASYAFLVRSIAVGLLVAVLLYLLKERLVRAALIFAAGVVLCIGPWMIYTRLNAPTEEQRREHNGHIVEPYTDQFWQRIPGDRFSGRTTSADLPDRVITRSWEAASDGMGELLATHLYYPLKHAGAGGSLWLALPLTLLVLIGYVAAARDKITMAEIGVPISLGIIFLWDWPPSRLVLPLLPFLIIYLLMGIRFLLKQHYRLVRPKVATEPWKGLAVAAGMLLAISLYGNVEYLIGKLGNNRPGWIVSFEEHQEFLNWIRENISNEDAIASHNPPLIYLFTGRKSVAVGSPVESWEVWKRLGVRYIARVPLKEGPVPDPDLNERRYNIVYRSKGARKLRVVDLGPKENRMPWGTHNPSSNQIKIDTSR